MSWLRLGLLLVVLGNYSVRVEWVRAVVTGVAKVTTVVAEVMLRTVLLFLIREAWSLILRFVSFSIPSRVSS
jgi:hypothetical protein